MARPIWKGNISFGLVYIPVTLYSAEKPASDLNFHLLDKRNHSRVRYQRLNETTGKEVPWENIEKAYEFQKGNYVVINQKELEKVAYENSQTVELERFINHNEIPTPYFIKPYFLIPTKQGEKGYILLRDTLERTGKVGIAKVVIRTRQHLAALIPYKEGLLLNLLRYHSELRDMDEYTFPKGDLKSYKITSKEIEMAERLIKSMSGRWDPKKYHDVNRELLKKWITQKVEKGIQSGAIETKSEATTKKTAEVIDFMSLLKKSVQENESKRGKKMDPKRYIKSKRASVRPRKSPHTMPIKRKNTGPRAKSKKPRSLKKA